MSSNVWRSRTKEVGKCITDYWKRNILFEVYFNVDVAYTIQQNQWVCNSLTWTCLRLAVFCWRFTSTNIKALLFTPNSHIKMPIFYFYCCKSRSTRKAKHNFSVSNRILVIGVIWLWLLFLNKIGILKLHYLSFYLNYSI